MQARRIIVWPTRGQSSIKARIDVEFDSEAGIFTIRGFRVVQPPGREPFVAVPQESYRDKSGKQAWKDIIWMERGLQNALYPQVIAEYKRVSEKAS